MMIDKRIKNKKLQCDINKKASEILVFSSGKMDQCEYLTGEEILPSD